MGRPKGLPKAGGRQKGSVNKVTAKAKERIEFVLGLLEETLEYDIAGLKPVERVNLWNDLQEFVRPKLSRSELHSTGTNQVTITFNREK